MTKFDGRLFLVIALPIVILKNGFCCKSGSKKKSDESIIELEPNPSFAWMSSTYKEDIASLSLINKCDNDDSWSYLSSTDWQDNPAWAVDLEVNYFVTNVIVNARHHERAKRFNKVYLIVTEEKPNLQDISFKEYCSYFAGPAIFGQRINFQCNDWGRFVTIAIKLKKAALEMCHISIFAEQNMRKQKLKKLEPNPSFAWMSSTYGTDYASRSLLINCYNDKAFTYLSGTNLQDNPAWAVDLEVNYFVTNVIVNARHSERAKRFNKVYLIVTEEKPNLQDVSFKEYCSYFAGPAISGQRINFQCNDWGRFVTIAIKLKKAALEMCHISIFAEQNIKKLELNPNSAWMSSTYKEFTAGRALENSCIHSGFSYLSATELEKNPQWTVDMQDVYPVLGVAVRVSNDEAEASEFNNVYVYVRAEVPESDILSFSDYCDFFLGGATRLMVVNFECIVASPGRYVILVLRSDIGVLQLCHIAVYIRI